MTVGEYFEKRHLPRVMETSEQAEDYLNNEKFEHQTTEVANAVLYLMGHGDHTLLRCYFIKCENCWFRNSDGTERCYKRMRDYVVCICRAGKREDIEALL